MNAVEEGFVGCFMATVFFDLFFIPINMGKVEIPLTFCNVGRP